MKSKKLKIDMLQDEMLNSINAGIQISISPQIQTVINKIDARFCNVVTKVATALGITFNSGSTS